MILVEFLDANPIENIGACFLENVSYIVYIGSDSVQKGNERVRKITSYLRKKGINAGTSYHHVAKNALPSAVRTLERIFHGVDEEVVIDLAGGNDTMLIAAGVVWEKRHAKGEHLSLITSSVEDGTVTFCHRDGCVRLSDSKRFENTIEENALLHGGSVINSFEIRPELSDSFLASMDNVWKVAMRGKGVRKNGRKSYPRRWNAFLSSLFAAGLISRVKGDGYSLSNAKKRLGANYGEVLLWLEALNASGAIRLEKRHDGDFISFTCLDGTQKLIEKAGNLLELKIYSEAVKSGMFTDCATGVCLDWDGRAGDTENEIDVMLMNGLVPVFISCKNGKIDDAELYKLSTVAERFGGEYAKKAIFVSDYGGVSQMSISSIKRRAENMGIRVVDNVNLIGRAELARIVRSLAK